MLTLFYNRILVNHFELTLYWTGEGDKNIINPMVQNMAPAYINAQYDYIWISSGRLEGKIYEYLHIIKKLMIYFD